MQKSAILFTQINPMILTHDPFIMDYHRLVLSHFCEANDFEIYDNTIFGGFGERDLFRKNMLPYLETLLKKSISRPKCLLVCRIEELGNDLELGTILVTLSRLKLEVITIYKNEKSNNVRLLGAN